MLLSGLVLAVRARRPDVMERQAQIIVQEAARRLARETHIIEGERVLDCTNLDLAAGRFGETFYPESTIPVSYQEDDGAAVTMDLPILRVVEVWLAAAGIPKVQLQLVSSSLFRAEMARTGHIPPGTKVATLGTGEDGRLAFWPGWRANGGLEEVQVRAVLGAPAGTEWLGLPMPERARPALMELALADAFELAGSGRDEAASRTHRIRAVNLMAGLKSERIVGMGPQARPGTPFDFRMR